MIDAAVRRLCLAPPAALGGPLAHGTLRTEVEDFVVDEMLGFEPAGSGAHVLLRVRKRNANTDWVAKQLAAVAGVRHFDVGFAGLKDRRAVTTQWFSVPAQRRDAASWNGHAGEGFEVLEAHAHTRKLPRGALAGNRFEIRVRDCDVAIDALHERVAVIAQRGVPNYFGPQRFGRELGNLRFTGRGRPGGYVISAARSLIFNAVLAARVEDDSWDALQTGDLANLDGSGSVFLVEQLDADLLKRVADLDLHPTGPLWGAEGTAPGAAVAHSEAAIAAGFPESLALLEAVGAEAARRSLRLALHALGCEQHGDCVLLKFEVRGGGFATTVLRELFEVREAGDHDAAGS